MDQSEGFKVAGKGNLVCRLKKSLYALEQVPRQWYKRFNSFITEHDFKKTLIDYCVFIKKYSSDNFIIFLLYIDDILIFGHDLKKIVA